MTIVAPLWVIVIIIAVGVTVNILYGPTRKRKASERRQLFIERNFAETADASVTFVDLKSVGAKRLLAGSFTISTSLEVSDIQEALIDASRNFPRKKTMFGMSGPVIMRDKRLDLEVVAYGSIAKTKTGGETVLDPDWSLALRASDEASPELAVARLKGSGSEVSEIEEMEYFIIELECNMRTRDTSATTAITFRP